MRTSLRTLLTIGLLGTFTLFGALTWSEALAAAGKGLNARSNARIQPGHPAFGLPASPKHRAHTAAQRALGRTLFFDRKISADSTMACASCHVPAQGFTTQGTATAVGIGGRSLERNAPTVVNVAWQQHLFLDGRERSLERLTWGPMLNAHEMGHTSIAQALRHVRQQAGYVKEFVHAYPGQGLTPQTFTQALAAYQRSLVAADSPFDRDRVGFPAGVDAPGMSPPGRPKGENRKARPEGTTMTTQARAGHALFIGKAGCVLCHAVEDTHANFTDNSFHVIGAGRRVDGDLGRFVFSGKPADRFAFKTPSLRNIARTAPYMHDGSLATLAEVIDFYDGGGGNWAGKSPMLRKLGLDADEKAALLAFLESLNSPHWDALVKNAQRGR